MIDYISLIKNDREIAEALDWPMDFILTDCDLNELSAYSKAPFRVIGKDGSGGLFGLIGEGDTNELSVGYVSSEGQAGRIAANLTDFFHLIVFFPICWHDLVGRDIKGMEKYAKEMELDEDELDAQEYLIEALTLDRNNYSVSKLYAALTELPKFVVYNNDGSDNEWEDLYK